MQVQVLVARISYRMLLLFLECAGAFAFPWFLYAIFSEGVYKPLIRHQKTEHIQKDIGVEYGNST